MHASFVRATCALYTHGVNDAANTTTRLLVIASVERTGSTLLCSILRQTQAAGTPLEYLNIRSGNFDSFRAAHGLPRYKWSFLPELAVRKMLRKAIPKNVQLFSRRSWRRYLLKQAEINTTRNGYFAVKMHWNQYRTQLVDMGLDLDMWQVPVTYLRISREDEVLQAISFMRAEQTQSWNATMSERAEAHYDPAAIERALEHIEAENRQWDRFFAERRLSPLHITFEQLTGDHEGTIRSVMEYLGAPVDSVPLPETRRQGDSRNSAWAERFVADHPHHAPRRSVRP